MKPLKLSDAAMDHVRNLAVPIPSYRRSEYLTAIASALADIPDPEPAQVYKVARTAQQRILYGSRRCDGPTLDGKTGLPLRPVLPLTPREQFEHTAASNPKFKQAPSNGEGVVIVGARPPAVAK
jgi:hypothetical protein